MSKAAQGAESGLWVVSTSHRGPNRKLHSDRDCRYLVDAVTVREPTDQEMDDLGECSECFGRSYRSSDGDWSYQRALRQGGTDD